MSEAIRPGRPPSQQDARARDRRLAVAAGASAVVVLLLAFLLGGVGAVLVVLTALAALATLLGVLGVPAAPPVRRRAPKPVRVENAPYRSYRHVAERLSWAGVSPRHYDVVTRPMLQRLMITRLADQHGIDVHRSPAAAEAMIGAELWRWLDPSRAPEGSSRPPGLDARTLQRLVERLEGL